MKQTSIIILLGFCLGVSLFFYGCGKGKPAPAAKPADSQTKSELPHEGDKPPLKVPFLGDDAKPAIEATLAGFQPFYRWGFWVIVSGAVAGLIFRSLFAAVCLSGGGMLGISTAVVLSNFPRVSLILPAVAAVLLTAVGVVWAITFIRKLWNAHKAVEVLVPLVDEMDTGPKSAGRKFKLAVEQTGKSGVVRRGIEYIKSKFRKTDADPAD